LDDCSALPRADDHFAVVLESADFPLDGSLRANDCWGPLRDDCSVQARFRDAPQGELPLLDVRSPERADSVVGCSLGSASPVWPVAPVSQREPRSLPGVVSAFRLGRLAVLDEPEALAVSLRMKLAVAGVSPSQSQSAARLLAAVLLRDLRCWNELPTLLPEPVAQ